MSIIKYVLVTGGFDPLHSGHLEYLKEAKKLGDLLIVGLNSDAWLGRKKGKSFMSFHERKAILESIRYVDRVLSFKDSDGTACDAIHKTLQLNSNPNSYVIFCNGGDRSIKMTPEYPHFKDNTNVEFVFDVGGSVKRNSSSWILSDWTEQKTFRSWGYYRVLHVQDGQSEPQTKVKEIQVNPGCKLSLQRHRHRSEYWIVAKGIATVEIDEQAPAEYNIHDSIIIPKGSWHRLSNKTEADLRIVEIQYGSKCEEDDIERIFGN